MRGLRRARQSGEEIEARIAALLAEMQPMLRMDHCSLAIVSFSAESGVLTLGTGGSCSDCDVSPATFTPAIEARLKVRIPEVTEVVIQQ
ncbi:MAG: NifU family protein [Gemmatimonadaceae bacterium]